MHTTKTGKTIARLIFAGILTVLLLAAVASCQKESLWQQRFLQFGTLIDVTVISDNEDKAEKLFVDIEALLVKRHSEWHGWRDGTLKQFNQSLSRQPQAGTLIPPTLKKLISDSKEYYRLSEGRFNPAMGKLIAAWGFHDKTEPDINSINTIKKDIPGMHDIVIKDDRAYSMNADLQLDFGAIAKGLGIKQVAELIKLQQIDNFIVNAGGDVYASGSKHDRPWRVAIENPFIAGIIGSLDMNSGSSIFTSGDYRRNYKDQDQPLRHHIIDPVTGDPSSVISSATVIHADPVVADVAATTLMLTAPSELKHMASRLGVEQYMVITREHEIYISQSMLSEIKWHNQDAFSLHVL